MERGREAKRLSGELGTSQIPCFQPAGPSLCCALGQMAACSQPGQMARAARIASGA